MIKTLLPILTLGPVTGGLTLLAVRYARAGRWFMTLVCALGIVEFWLGGPVLLAWLVSLR